MGTKDVEEAQELTGGLSEIRWRNPVKRLGFAQIEHAITFDPLISASGYRLYSAYLYYAHQGENCWPSTATIGRLLDLTPYMVSKLNVELENAGYITRERRMHKSSITWMEDVGKIPRLQELAKALLEGRNDSENPEISSLSTVQTVDCQLTAISSLSTDSYQLTEEEPIEEETNYINIHAENSDLKSEFDADFEALGESRSISLAREANGEKYVVRGVQGLVNDGTNGARRRKRSTKPAAPQPGPGDASASPQPLLLSEPNYYVPNWESGVKTTRHAATSRAKERTVEQQQLIDRQREIMGAYRRVLGYAVPNEKQANAGAKVLAKNYTAEQVVGCYEDMKRQPYWRDIHISLQSVNKQIGEWAKKQKPRERPMRAADEEVMRMAALKERMTRGEL